MRIDLRCLRPWFSICAVLFLLTNFQVLAQEDNERDCDALPEDRRDVCKMLLACREIEDVETKQECFRLALGSEDPVAESDATSDQESVSSTAEPTTDSDEPTPDEPEATAEQKAEKKGFFRRLTGAVTRPFKSSGRTEQDDESTSATETSEEETEEQSDTENQTWVVKIVRVGIIDRTTHLIRVDDDRVFQYESPEELRFRVNENVEIKFFRSWISEGYQLRGKRGPVRRATLLPCRRIDLKGNTKTRCEKMLR